MLGSYWGSARVYHHTAPVPLHYALREALEVVLEEGLEQRWSRHQKNHRALVAGIESLGLKMHVSPEHRLWSLNTLRIPDGVDDVQVRGQLLQDFNLEIGSGLGELKGTIWRVGLMGENSSPETVLYFLYALENSTSGLEAFRVNLARVSRPPHNTTAQQPERERLRPVLARRNDGAKVELLKESGTIGASLVRRGSERVAPEPQCS